MSQANDDFVIFFLATHNNVSFYTPNYTKHNRLPIFITSIDACLKKDGSFRPIISINFFLMNNIANI